MEFILGEKTIMSTELNTFVSLIVFEYQEKVQNQMENLASQYTVLVVDDVPTNVMLVQAILKKEGYTLLTTDSGAKALRIAQERHPNLILLDIMMPEMDGYEVLQHLKSNPETNNIPVIIMSALSDMQSIVKGYQLGATEYVTKPFQREELVKRVAHRYELFSIKRIKQELENTIESRDTLYSVIAHDLRSPLGSLKMMNNAILMMVDKNQVSDEVYEMLQMNEQDIGRDIPASRQPLEVGKESPEQTEHL